MSNANRKPTPRLHEPAPPAMRWTTDPPPATELSNFRLVRVQAGRPTGGVILSAKPVGHYTHYYRKRTMPCIGERCEACRDGNSPRWYGYLFVWNHVTHVQSVLELPASTVRALLDRYNHLTTWRGCTIVTERVPNKPNGRVHATIRDTISTHPDLPTSPNITAVLEHIWEFAINENFRHGSN